MPDTAPSLPIDNTKIRLLTGINPAQALGYAVSYLELTQKFSEPLCTVQ